MEKKLYFKRNSDENNDIVIFLHGLYSSSQSFNKLLEILSDDINYIAIDLPSHGKSFDMKLSIETIGEEIISFINENELKDISFVGHSLGGAVATYVASKISVNNLILIDSYNPFVIESLSISTLSELINPKNEASLISTFKKMMNNNPLAILFAKVTWEKIKNNISNFNYLLNKQLLSKIYSKTLEDIFLSAKVNKVSLINMENDPIVPLESTIKTSKIIDNSKVYTINASGHSPQYSHPEDVKEIILKTLVK